MESYEVLAQAIPKKASERVAQLLNVSADYIRKWRREPESADAPLSSGQRSILDRICELIDAVFLVNPQGVALIIAFINNHYKQLVQTHAMLLVTTDCRVKQTGELLTEATQAINRLNSEGCTNETLRELIEMRDAADRAIESVQKTMRAKEEEKVN